MTQAEILNAALQLGGLAVLLAGALWRFGQKFADFERRMEARTTDSERAWAERFAALRLEMGLGFERTAAATKAASVQVEALSRCHDEDLASRRDQGQRIEQLATRMTVVETLRASREG